MYVGHVGAALVAKSARTNIGLLALLVATYTPDWVDGGLCLAGSYSSLGMLSHSVPAVVIFALIGFTLYACKTGDWTSALVIAGLIVSHMVLDWITGYKPTWPGGPRIGLRLYHHPVADFIVEAALIVAGAILYGRTLSPRQRPWIDVSIMLGALLALQVVMDVAHVMMKSLPKC